VAVRMAVLYLLLGAGTDLIEVPVEAPVPVSTP
jgi:hypothetical protein